MILLYLIAILCSLVLFAPTIVPIYIKWPVALGVVLLIIFFFNLPKKDTVYATHPNRKNIYNFGLFNPLFMYFSASSYVLGFAFIFTALAENNSSDIVANISTIPTLVNFNPLSTLTIGLLFVLAGILFYFLRNAFRAYASKSSLKFRSFWYVVFTFLSLGVGVFYFINFYSFDIYQYLSIGYNLYIYFGLATLVVLIDLSLIVCAVISRRRKTKKSQELLKVAEDGTDAPLTKKELKAKKREEKRNKIIAKKRAKSESRFTKKQAKIDKKAAKLEAKKAKKQAKYNEKVEKLKK